MAEIFQNLGAGIACAGALLALIGCLGMYRFPDIYTRIHAARMTDTGAASLILLGLGLIAGANPVTYKLALIWILFMLTTPAAANVLASGALGAGHRPRTGSLPATGGQAASSASPQGEGG